MVKSRLMPLDCSIPQAHPAPDGSASCSIAAKLAHNCSSATDDERPSYRAATHAKEPASSWKPFAAEHPVQQLEASAAVANQHNSNSHQQTGMGTRGTATKPCSKAFGTVDGSVAWRMQEPAKSGDRELMDAMLWSHSKNQNHQGRDGRIEPQLLGEGDLFAHPAAMQRHLPLTAGQGQATGDRGGRSKAGSFVLPWMRGLGDCKSPSRASVLDGSSLRGCGGEDGRRSTGSYVLPWMKGARGPDRPQRASAPEATWPTRCFTTSVTNYLPMHCNITRSSVCNTTLHLMHCGPYCW